MSDAAIRDAINQIAGTARADKVYSFDAIVKSVDVAKRTATVQVSSGKASNIIMARLMASVDDGLLLIPAVDSTVCVILSDFTAPYISQYSELDKVLIISGSSSIEIKDGKIQLNDGSYDGLVKVTELTDRLNKIEDRVNAHVAIFNAHLHTSTGSPPATSDSQTLTPTQQSQIENKKVTHGT